MREGEREWEGQGGRGREGVMKSGSKKERHERRERVMKGGRSYKGNGGEVKGRESGMREGLIECVGEGGRSEDGMV